MLLALSGAAILTFLVARGELAGADARAYWGAVRVWLDGGDPLRPPTPYLPYVYVPWSVPLFLPWAVLPWDVAWFLWRGANVILLLWTAGWAYRRHPLATALLVVLMAAPIAATLDTGNITLFAALAVWAAMFVGPRVGGGLWAFAAVIKWFPAPLWLILPPRARLWGLVWLGSGRAPLGRDVAADRRPAGSRGALPQTTACRLRAAALGSGAVVVGAVGPVRAQRVGRCAARGPPAGGRGLVGGSSQRTPGPIGRSSRVGIRSRLRGPYLGRSL